MPVFKKTKVLKKELALIDVFAIAAGTTLSAGFFLLPGIAARQAGAAMILAYVLAALPLIPAMFSIVELATAMPRAGGVYFFLDRSMGPLFGTIGGIGTWLALVLKVTFALVGMGAYLSLFFEGVPITPLAVAFAVLIGVLNLFGSKKSGTFQIFLVVLLLVLLSAFIVGGLPELHYEHFGNFFGAGFQNIFAAAGLVYISYVGVTKIASLSEEIKNPEKNLPLGVFLALGTAILIYVLGTTVMVGVLPMKELSGNLTPVASAAEKIFGRVGEILLSIAALLAFVSVANAGTMSASRYPLAMSRDHIVPDFFKKLNRKGMPASAILVTVLIIVVILLIFDPAKIAKLASAFQLLMFSLVCLAVIVMRESKISSYDPGYKSPFYPWMQIFGIASALFLIGEMGTLPLIFSTGLIILSVVWYFAYARERVVRAGAIYHVFERLGRHRYDALDTELRSILKEKGLRKDDPFDQIVMRAKVFDIDREMKFEEVLDYVSDWLSRLMPLKPEEIKEQFLEGTRVGATPVTRGVALPHFRLEAVPQTEMVLVRSKRGVKITLIDPLTHEPEEEETVKALFFLVSPENNPTLHLRILAQIAGRVDDSGFFGEWMEAHNEQELKEALLHDDRFLSVTVKSGEPSGELIGKTVATAGFSPGCLITLITRFNETIVPSGQTKILEGDRLTILGEPEALKKLKEKLLR